MPLMQRPELPEIPPVARLSFANAIKVLTPAGVVDVFPFHTIRGEGEKQYHISIHGFTTTEVQPMQTCYCCFRGARYRGYFFYVSPKHRGKYTVQFETIIPDDAFWNGTGEPHLD